MKKLVSFIVIILTILISVKPVESKGNNAGVVILTGGGIIALGGGVFFIIRNIVRNHNCADSITTEVKFLWERSERAFENDDFIGCISNLEKIASIRNDYGKFVLKRKLNDRFDIDTLDSFISSCRLLENLKQSVASVASACEEFPEDEFELEQVDRSEVTKELQKYAEFIDSIENANPRQRETVRYGFRESLKKIADLNLLLKDTHDQAKREFALKCKFYFNRAKESADTNQLREFVNTCKYYQIDNQWRIQAQAILEPESIPDSKTEVQGFAKLSPLDSMRLQYDTAVKSGRIDLLETYISRYAKGPFKKKLSKVDKAKIVLDSLQRILDIKVRWNKSHPLFANCDTCEFSFVVKGLRGEIETVFINEFNSMSGEFKNIRGPRFPSGIVIDYSYSPSILLFKGFIDCKNDVVHAKENGVYTYNVSGVEQTMELLNQLKRNVVASLENKGNVALQEIVSIRSAAYIVRLRKNESEYITFYGKEYTSGKKGVLEFYDFYDIKINRTNDIRLENGFSPLVKFPSPVNPDTCLTCKFFE